MGRLFYNPVSSTDDQKFRTAQGSPDIGLYLEKVTKLIPVEILGGYISILGFLDTIRDAQTLEYTKWSVFLLCLILTPIYLWRLADKQRPFVPHLIVSTIAFIVWAYAVSGRILIPTLFEPSLSSIALIIFTMISSIIPIDKSL